MIALYPGAFKPPHRGHFEVVKRLLKGNHGGHVYSIDNYQDVGTKALSGEEGKVEKINKVEYNSDKASYLMSVFQYGKCMLSTYRDLK